MSDKVKIIQAIRRAAKRRQKAEEARHEAMDELLDECLKAQDAGIPITEIAREAGLSRQAVYDLLARR